MAPFGGFVCGTALLAVVAGSAAVADSIVSQMGPVSKYQEGVRMTSHSMRELGSNAGRKLRQQSSAQVKLLAAIVDGDRDTFNSLVNSVDLNFEVPFEDIFITPLITAILSDRPEFITPLIQAGADPEITNSDDLTPLEIATIRDDAAAIEALAQGGADVNRNNPLFRAAMFGKQNAARALIAAGADPDAVDTKLFFTPLQAAAILGRREIIIVLLDAGASPNAAFRGTAKAVDLVCSCVAVDDDLEALKKECDFDECENAAAIRALLG